MVGRNLYKITSCKCDSKDGAKRLTEESLSPGSPNGVEVKRVVPCDGNADQIVRSAISALKKEGKSDTNGWISVSFDAVCKAISSCKKGGREGYDAPPAVPTVPEEPAGASFGGSGFSGNATSSGNGFSGGNGFNVNTIEGGGKPRVAPKKPKKVASSSRGGAEEVVCPPAAKTGGGRISLSDFLSD